MKKIKPLDFDAAKRILKRMAAAETLRPGGLIPPPEFALLKRIEKLEARIEKLERRARLDGGTQ